MKKVFIYLPMMVIILSVAVCFCASDCSGSTLQQRLHQINTRFQRTYEQLKQHYLDRILEERRQVIFVDEYGDLVTYYSHAGCSHSHTQSTDKYNALKSMAHMPAAVALELLTMFGRYDKRGDLLSSDHVMVLDDSWRGEVVKLRRELNHLLDNGEDEAREKSLEDTFGSRDVLSRQRDMVHEALAFLDELLKEGSLSRDRVKRYAISMVVPMMQNADNAADEQISWLWHNTLLFMRQCNVTQNDLQRDYVVILMGPMLPSRRNLQQQFFERVLGARADRARDRIIFVQNVQDEAQAAFAAATSMQDRQLSLLFFDRDWRLHEGKWKKSLFDAFGYCANNFNKNRHSFGWRREGTR